MWVMNASGALVNLDTMKEIRAAGKMVVGVGPGKIEHLFIGPDEAAANQFLQDVFARLCAQATAQGRHNEALERIATALERLAGAVNVDSVFQVATE